MKEVKKLVQGRAVRELVIADIQVDESYQREVKRGHLKIIESYDENALGLPVVGEREDGTLCVVDGRQRIEALKKMGRTRVRCDVFNSKGPEHEASVFNKINLNRTKLHPHEQFRARLAEGDSDAWAIHNLVEKCGFVLRLRGGKHRNDAGQKEVTCVGTLNHVYESWGPETIETFLKVFQESGWVADPAWTNSVLVYGFCSWLAQNDGENGIDKERLVRNMRTTTPGKLMFSSTLGAGNRQTNMIDLVAKLYRKKVRVAPQDH